MRHTQSDACRILAIDLHTRGVGFVVLEKPDLLVDWGVRQVRPKTKPADPELKHVAALLERYDPHVVVVEDVDAPGCRRRARAKRLTRAIQDLAQTLSTPVTRYSWKTVRSHFGSAGAYTKAQIAAAVALRFSQLVRHLPPLRKPWMSEDYRFSIFDAAAFALTYLHEQDATDVPF